MLIKLLIKLLMLIKYTSLSGALFCLKNLVGEGQSVAHLVAVAVHPVQPLALHDKVIKDQVNSRHLMAIYRRKLSYFFLRFDTIIFERILYRVR